MKIKTLNQDNIELILGYIKKAFSQASEFLDDENVKTDGTYSSYKIENIKLELKNIWTIFQII